MTVVRYIVIVRSKSEEQAFLGTFHDRVRAERLADAINARIHKAEPDMVSSAWAYVSPIEQPGRSATGVKAMVDWAMDPADEDPAREATDG